MEVRLKSAKVQLPITVNSYSLETRLKAFLT